MVSITTLLDPETYKRFKIKLAQDGARSVTVIRLMIDDYLTGKWVPKLEAKKERAETDEE